MKEYIGDSRAVARAALSLAMTADREEEAAMRRYQGAYTRAFDRALAV